MYAREYDITHRMLAALTTRSLLSQRAAHLVSSASTRACACASRSQPSSSACFICQQGRVSERRHARVENMSQAEEGKMPRLLKLPHVGQQPRVDLHSAAPVEEFVPVTPGLALSGPNLRGSILAATERA